MRNAVARRGFAFGDGEQRRLLKTPHRALQVILNEFAARPRSAKFFARLAGDTRAAERVYYEVSRVREHPHKILRQVHGEPRWMCFDAALRAVADVGAVALGVSDGDEVWRNRRAV